MPLNTLDESLTEDESTWLSAPIGGGFQLHKNTSCYSTNFFDDSRSSKALRAACAGPLKPSEMMVMVTTLNTGRKVVVVSSKGVTQPSAGWTTDPFVSLYEVTQELGPYRPNTRNVGAYGSPAGDANRVAFGVAEDDDDFADFMLEESLSSGTCFIGEGVGDYRIKSIWGNGTAESYKAGPHMITRRRPLFRSTRAITACAVVLSSIHPLNLVSQHDTSMMLKSS